MKIKDKAINKLHLFNSFSKMIESTKSFDEIFKETMTHFESNFTFNSIIIFLFDDSEKLQIKVKTGIATSKLVPSKVLDEKKILREDFQEKKVKQFNNWHEEKDLQAIFFDSSQIKSVLLIPLISNNYLLGFISIGETTDYVFSDKEIVLFESIGLLISYTINHFICQENILVQNSELKEITKRMRHDFANDFQSISMALELISGTDLNDQQEKYVKILEKAKTSMIEKLQELKQLKYKYEKDVESPFGIPLK